MQKYCQVKPQPFSQLSTSTVSWNACLCLLWKPSYINAFCNMPGKSANLESLKEAEEKFPQPSNITLCKCCAFPSYWELLRKGHFLVLQTQSQGDFIVHTKLSVSEDETLLIQTQRVRKTARDDHRHILSAFPGKHHKLQGDWSTEHSSWDTSILSLHWVCVARFCWGVLLRWWLWEAARRFPMSHRADASRLQDRPTAG